MKKVIALGVTSLVMTFAMATALNSSSAANVASVRFDITYPASASKDGLDGRLLLLVSTNKDEEPRLHQTLRLQPHRAGKCLSVLQGMDWSKLPALHHHRDPAR